MKGEASIISIPNLILPMMGLDGLGKPANTS